jgi:hypothetical protein
MRTHTAVTIKTVERIKAMRYSSCSCPSDRPERDGGEGITGVFEAGVVSKLLLQQHDAPRMTLLGLVVDLADLACHLVVTIRERANLDVIGSRPLLVGFDSSL